MWQPVSYPGDALVPKAIFGNSPAWNGPLEILIYSITKDAIRQDVRQKNQAGSEPEVPCGLAFLVPTGGMQAAEPPPVSSLAMGPRILHC